jgi:UDPglucose--hexose-1-phosphate uridylyltransferase
VELRKDPITRSWVVVGHSESVEIPIDPCPLCPDNEGDTRTILQFPAQGPWQVRVFPHFRPLYRIEGEPGRSAEGIYDRMSGIGAHEILVDTPNHQRGLAGESPERIALVLEAYARRIVDLKRDPRFKYITVFKNEGANSGQEWPHSHSQITATTFVPRRVLYELRAARDWFRERDRCVFCDILRQEEKQEKRVVDAQGNYVAFCPYASRVPFETWILPRRHNHEFEAPGSEDFLSLGALLGRFLRRLPAISQGYHMVVHTSPNSLQTKGELSDYWQSISDDYHWHIEILPIVPTSEKSYVIKEVYFNGLMPEQAAQLLRQVNPGS